MLREKVCIKTATIDLCGELFIGADGLPELVIRGRLMPEWHEVYRPAEFPATWRLSSSTCGELYIAWMEIEAIRTRLAAAQREVETEDRDRAQQREIVETDEEERERAHNRSINNQIASEIDNDQID